MPQPKIFALLADTSCSTFSGKQPTGEYVTSEAAALKWVEKRRCTKACSCYDYEELKEHHGKE